MQRDLADLLTAWKARKDAGDTAEPLLIHKEFTPEIRAEGATEDRTRRFTITDAGEDRDGDTVAIDGWTLTNYKKNPVVLWAHDYHMLPIAQSLSIAMADARLSSLAKFATADENPFAEMVLRLIDGGYLRATSVGFIPTKWTFNEKRSSMYGPAVDFLEQELLEYSIVPVPSNPRALLDAKSKGINLAPLREWAERTLDDWHEEKGLWLPRTTVEEALKVMTNKTVHPAAGTTKVGAWVPVSTTTLIEERFGHVTTQDAFDALSGAEKIELYYLTLGTDTDKAQWSTAYINSLEDNCFAAIESGGEKDGEGKTTPRSLRHYPHHPKGEGASGTGGTVDEAHLKNALSRIGDPDNFQGGKAHLEAHAKKEGIGDDGKSVTGPSIQVPIELIGDADVIKQLVELAGQVKRGRVLSEANHERIKKAHEAFGDVMTACQMGMDHLKAVIDAAGNSETDAGEWNNTDNPLDASDPDNDGDGDVNHGGKGADEDLIQVGDLEMRATDFTEIIRAEVRGQMASLTGRLD